MPDSVPTVFHLLVPFGTEEGEIVTKAMRLNGDLVAFEFPEVARYFVAQKDLDFEVEPVGGELLYKVLLGCVMEGTKFVHLDPGTDHAKRYELSRITSALVGHMDGGHAKRPKYPPGLQESNGTHFEAP